MRRKTPARSAMLFGPNRYQVFAQMRIFLTGVSCVGKTTIGAKLAALLDYAFVDLDAEIESYFGTSIERLRRQYLTVYSSQGSFKGVEACSYSQRQSGLRHCLAAKRPHGQLLAGCKKG
jgi:Shikimate kinase